MSSFQPGTRPTKGYVDPTPMPENVPKVAELGVTSAPLKSAAFFIGAYCKEFNGMQLFDIICVLLGSAGHAVGYFLKLTLDLCRGLHALQEREPGSGALFEGGTTSYKMCNGPVSLSGCSVRPNLTHSPHQDQQNARKLPTGV